MSRLSDIANAILAPFGYEMHRRGTWRPKTLREVLGLASSLGFSPTTILDIGIADGTPDLYAAFPDASILLVEPLKEYEPSLQRVLQKRTGFYHIAAAGRSSGTIELNVHVDHLAGSSIYKESGDSSFDGVSRQVDLVRVDQLVAEHELAGPYVLKIDTQGAELDVLAGAESILQDVEMVLLETSLYEFMKDAPQVAEVITFMREIGYSVWDIYEPKPRLLDGALGQIDMAFVRDDGSFRKSHAFATREQWDNEVR